MLGRSGPIEGARAPRRSKRAGRKVAESLEGAWWHPRCTV